MFTYKKTEAPFRAVKYTINVSDNEDMADELLVKLSEENNNLKNAACWLHISEEAMETSWLELKESDMKSTNWFKIVKQLGYKFHRNVGGEYVYYRWIQDENNPVEDSVPSFATSIEGVSVFVFSPCKTKLLLVHEYGKYKAITGALKYGENETDAVIREVKEESGLDVDEESMKWIGCWRASKARFGMINDNHHAFLASCKDMSSLKADGFEIKETNNFKWFPISDVLYWVLKHKDDVLLNDKPAFAQSFVVNESQNVSYACIFFLENTLQGNMHRGGTTRSYGNTTFYLC
ncbi:NUDIX hydrolase [Orpheovirus IHUMI-LCC2]|uniref:NUDIX hydrolase n=1 Tax=Orpheovirus IHUMI-LCC2 TaxID=2023057 RepID=A0A2I2L4V4_9VIRU|nr:NUDIX hydrolase [Orpheovirus IHUMI-LCC2]SNW62489.1 NUDIX hydrolase [Orpheovirus IHUMI-LCC2]